MNRDDIQKLLGGYATGTLTPEEQRAMFEAALTDQELFDSLMREEPLRDVLGDPATRAHLLAALDESPAPWHRAWWRPMLVMGAVFLVVAGVAVWDHSQQEKPRPTIAKMEKPRFQPPVATQNAPPVLPPPPEVARARKPIPSLPLPPAVMPMAPPPAQPGPITLAAPAPAPPPVSAGAQGGAVASISLQQQQLRQEPSQQQAPQPQVFARDGAARPTSAAFRGTVTDPTGAAIPGANVIVKSLDTGDTVSASTDARGDFTAPAPAGGNYQITASKQGFETASAKDVAPESTPVKLQLPVSASSQTVEVEASTRAVERNVNGALGARIAPRMMKAQAEAVPAIAYQLLRAVRGGSPVEVPAGATVPARSELILRVTPATSGELRVDQGARAVARRRVRSGVATEIKLPRFDQPGQVELQLHLATANAIVVFTVE